MSSTKPYPLPASIVAGVTARDLLRNKPSELWRVSPGASVYEAVGQMAQRHVGVLLVMHKEQLVGIMSERDYARKVILKGRSSRDTRVEEIMTSTVVTIGLDSTMQDCMRLMTTHRVRHLPVVEQDCVVGVVSIGDVVREALAQQSHALAELERYIAGEPGLKMEDEPQSSSEAH